MKKIVFVFAVLFAIAGSAHAQFYGNGGYYGGGYGGQDRNPNAGSYDRNQSLSAGQVIGAMVVAVNVVRVAPSQTAQYTGRALGGTVVGAILNRQGKDRSASTQVALTALGGILGAVAGDFATEQIADSQAFEIVVRFDDGRMAAITQADNPPMPGEKVGVLTNGMTARIIRL